MNFQQNWLKVLECVDKLIYLIICNEFPNFCEIKCDIFEKKSIK